MIVSIIGAGKVGTTLAVLLHRAGYRIVSVISRKKDSAQKLARLVECENYSDLFSDLHPLTKILLIAVPDEAINRVSNQIVRHAKLDFPQLIAFHASGSLTSDVLSSLHKKRATVFSLHPIQSFPKKSTIDSQLLRMKDVYYGFEGKETVFNFARHLVKAFGGRIVRIPKERKILYHIACVFASNYSVVLLGVVDELLKRVGGDVRLKHIETLMKSSIDNAFQLTPKDALTGPIVRGSIETIKKHMLELEKKDQRSTILYSELGTRALDIAKKRKTLTLKTLKQIRNILISNK